MQTGTFFNTSPPIEKVANLQFGVCQISCPPISCDVSDFGGADFGFRVEPDGASRLTVAGLT